MFAYIIRRLLLIVPTLLGIMIINFAIVQVAPGGPVEQTIAELEGRGISATARFTSAGGETVATTGSNYRGARGLDPEFVKEIEKQREPVPAQP